MGGPRIQDAGNHAIPTASSQYDELVRRLLLEQHAKAEAFRLKDEEGASFSEQGPLPQEEHQRSSDSGQHARERESADSRQHAQERESADSRQHHLISEIVAQLRDGASTASFAALEHEVRSVYAEEDRARELRVEQARLAWKAFFQRYPTSALQDSGRGSETSKKLKPSYQEDVADGLSGRSRRGSILSSELQAQVARVEKDKLIGDTGTDIFSGKHELGDGIIEEGIQPILQNNILQQEPASDQWDSFVLLSPSGSSKGSVYRYYRRRRDVFRSDEETIISQRISTSLDIGDDAITWEPFSDWGPYMVLGVLVLGGIAFLLLFRKQFLRWTTQGGRMRAMAGRRRPVE
ncbi:unnamed protein product [Amoebophrya sp. A25]|nr:unnamed protein product [Amoebophrya sp. A25]|eukprot:GSA25T00018706001.1